MFWGTFSVFHECMRCSSSKSCTALSRVITVFPFSMYNILPFRKHLNSSSQGAYCARFHQRERWGNCPAGWDCNLRWSLLKPSHPWLFPLQSRWNRKAPTDLPLLSFLVPLAYSRFHLLSFSFLTFSFHFIKLSFKISPQHPGDGHSPRFIFAVLPSQRDPDTLLAFI